MTRKLILLNLVLATLIGLIGWYVRGQWIEARKREWQIMTQQLRSVPAPPITPAIPPPPVQAASYSEVAQKLLFSKDRNPAVEVIITPPPPMPPLPVAHGVFLFGNAPTLLLSETASGPHKSYRPGDMVGEFKLVSVNNTEVEFDWNGKSIKRSLQEMLEEGRKSAQAQQAAEQSAAPAPPAPAAPAASSAALASQNKVGPPPGEGVRPCSTADTSPAGTVIDGMRKTISRSPFGNVCRWEPAN